MARVVLEAEPGAQLPERDPGRLAAPAHVDDLLRNGSSASNAAHVFGARFALPAAPNAYGPAVIVRSSSLSSVGLDQAAARRRARRGRRRKRCGRAAACARSGRAACGRRTGWRGGGQGARAEPCSRARSTSARSASAPGSSRPLRQPQPARGGARSRARPGAASGSAAARALVEQQRERASGRRRSRPRRAAKSPAFMRGRARRMVGGDEGDAARRERAHSASRSAAGAAAARTWRPCRAAPRRPRSGRGSAGRSRSVASTPRARASATGATPGRSRRARRAARSRPPAPAGARARSPRARPAAGARQPSARQSPPRRPAQLATGSLSRARRPAGRARRRAHARAELSSSAAGKSSMPLSDMNALKPATPRSASSSSRSSGPGTSPPQSAKSTWARASARPALASKARAVDRRRVGVQRHLDAGVRAARRPARAVPVAKPSQSARPGSLKCTWASIAPGSTCSPRASISSRRRLERARARSPRSRPSATPTSAAQPRAGASRPCRRGPADRSRRGRPRKRPARRARRPRRPRRPPRPGCG